MEWQGSELTGEICELFKPHHGGTARVSGLTPVSRALRLPVLAVLKVLKIGLKMGQREKGFSSLMLM
jgi:hypothetical protein